MRKPALVAFFLVLGSVSSVLATNEMLPAPHVSKPFFNPSLGEDVSLTISLPAAGKLTAVVLDRDGYAVRYVSRDEAVAAGETVLRWNGRDSEGTIVPDEAYSFKIDLVNASRHWAYFPAEHSTGGARSIAVRWYDPRSGIVSYDLPAASRVHIQAGSAVLGRDGKADGPVLKTIVDEQPRVGGSVIEQWRNGLDESGTIYIPDQPHFVMSIVASPLPENSVITVGNRFTTYVQQAAHRRGKSLLRPIPTHDHHAGLQTLDDVAPSMKLTLTNASWSTPDKAWLTGSPLPHIDVQLEGPSAVRFAKNSEVIVVFLDGKRVLTQKPSSPKMALTIPMNISRGTHLLAVNWIGRHGPVAVNSLRLINTTTEVSAR